MNRSDSSPGYSDRRFPRLFYLLFSLGLVVLALAVAALLFLAYLNYWLPFNGYGDGDMSYLENKHPQSLSGGDLTHFHVSEEAFGQEAPNLSWGLSMAFERGDLVFARAFTPTLKSDWRGDADGLGPLFNHVSCESCHPTDGRSKPPAGPNEVIEGGFVRVSIPGRGPYGASLSPPGYGAQISDRGIPGIAPEARVRIDWEEIPGQFPDGETYSLRKPLFLISDLAYGPLPNNTIYEMRIAPPLIGLGLLEAVPEQTILGWADPGDQDGDGISGRPNFVWDIERGGKILGRFSWKANSFDVRQQAASAAFNDIGINNELFLYRHDDQEQNHKTRQNCEPEQIDCLNSLKSPDFEMRPDQLRDVTTYLQLLGVVYRRNLDDPLVQQGEQLFHKSGCANCHKSAVLTGEHEIARLEDQLIRPYTDLLLHDMGEGLTGRPDFEASQQEWRTAPLWGIGLTETVNGHTNFLHDGRARNIQEAILWHGGEAETARKNYMQLNRAERKAVLTFINNL